MQMDQLNVFYLPGIHQNLKNQLYYITKAYDKFSSLFITDDIDTIKNLARTNLIKNFINISGTLPSDVQFDKIEDSIRFNNGTYTIYS